MAYRQLSVLLDVQLVHSKSILILAYFVILHTYRQRIDNITYITSLFPPVLSFVSSFNGISPISSIYIQTCIINIRTMKSRPLGGAASLALGTNSERAISGPNFRPGHVCHFISDKRHSFHGNSDNL